MKYLYTAQCQIRSSNVQDLLWCAHEFEVDSLLNKIETYYQLKLDSGDCDVKYTIELLELSQKYNLEDVKTKSMETIRNNKNAPMSPAWKELLRNNPKVLSEIYQ